MIELKNITKRYGNKIAVDDLNLTIGRGRITMLIGPSGCGKTTTLKMINRLVEPSKGQIFIDGTDIMDMDPVALRRQIGYVIQNIGLFPHYTVYDNIAIVPRLLKWNEKRIQERVLYLLDTVTLNVSFADKYPLQLSGGERQRVGLARALAADPDVLLMDEPFGAIDPINRLTLQESFLEIQEEIEKTIVFVTHDINEAIKLGDEIVIMKDGSLVQCDSVADVLENPEDEFVENLLGHDRSLKALSLKKAKSFVVTDGIVIITEGDHLSVNRERLIRQLENERFRSAYVVDADGRLKGKYVLDKSFRTESVCINYESEITYVERNTSVTDTLSRMLEAGEKQLPVVDRRGRFVGCIRLVDIFTQVTEAESRDSLAVSAD